MCPTTFFQKLDKLLVAFTLMLALPLQTASRGSSESSQISQGEQDAVPEVVLQKYEQQLRTDIEEGKNSKIAMQRLLALKLYLQHNKDKTMESSKWRAINGNSVDCGAIAQEVAEVENSSLKADVKTFSADWNGSREVPYGDIAILDGTEEEAYYSQYFDPEKLNARLVEINQLVFGPLPTEREKAEAMKSEIEKRFLRDRDAVETKLLDVCVSFARNESVLSAKIWKGLNPQRFETESFGRAWNNRNEMLDFLSNESGSDCENSLQHRLRRLRCSYCDVLAKLEKNAKELFPDGLSKKLKAQGDRLGSEEDDDSDELPEGQVIQLEQQTHALLTEVNQVLKTKKEQLTKSGTPEQKAEFNDLVEQLSMDTPLWGDEFSKALLDGVKEIKPPVAPNFPGGGDSNPPIHGPGAPTVPVTMPPVGIGDSDGSGGSTLEKGFWSTHKWHFITAAAIFCIAAPAAFAVAYKKAWLPKKLQAWTERMLAKFKRQSVED